MSAPEFETCLMPSLPGVPGLATRMLAPEAPIKSLAVPDGRHKPATTKHDRHQPLAVTDAGNRGY